MKDIPFALQQLNNVGQCDLSGLGEWRDITTNNASSSDNEQENEEDVGESDAEENANTNVSYTHLLICTVQILLES